MNLNIEYLLNKLSSNTTDILEKIHSDKLLTKRQCNITGLWIANASKQLFSPEHEHQLFSKGIIYERIGHTYDRCDNIEYSYRLISLPLLKIYNYGENQDVKTHVAEMIQLGAEPVFISKLDGSLCQRFVYNGKVYFATRGLMETMTENDEQAQYFNWARKIAEDKYPKILDPNYLSAGTSIFELIGPGNQIVTYYPNWDLPMIGFCKIKPTGSSFYDILGSTVNKAFDFQSIEYMSYGELVKYNEEFGFANPATKLYTFGNTLEEQIQSIDRLFSNTDDEGSVIQFEKKDQFGIPRVVGRIKAKTDNYRKLLKIMRNCNYEVIADMVFKEQEGFSEWETFELYLKSMGLESFPEELLETCKSYFEEFWGHMYRCNRFYQEIDYIAGKILGENKIKFKHGPSAEVTMDKKARAEFAFHVQSHPFKGCLFSVLDGKLNTNVIYERILKSPTDSIKALKEINEWRSIKKNL